MIITLSNLTGSEKQISWAKKIRAERIGLLLKMHKTIINQYNEHKDNLIDEIGEEEYNRQIEIITNTVQNFIDEKTSSRYWIDQHTSHATCDFFFNGARTWYHNQVQNKIGNDLLSRSMKIIHNLK